MKTASQFIFFLLVVAVGTSLGADHDDIFDRLKSRLPPGWTAIQTETGVIVRRETPLTLYNPISMPSHTNAAIEERKYSHEYRLSVTCKPNISFLELKRLERENAKTDEQMEAKREEMRDFWGKGSYEPRTPKQQSIYEDYRTKLRTLPYHVLPDGKFGESFVYVESSFPHGYIMFYDVRDRYDCLSAVSAILTVIEPVEPSSLRFGWDEKQASEILWARRPWEKHDRQKDRETR